MASLCPLSAAPAFPRAARPRAASFRGPASWSGLAATASNACVCSCGLLPTGGYARLRSRLRSPVRAKIDEADKGTGAGLGFPSPRRRKLRLRLRPRLRLLWWRLRRLSPRELMTDAGAALRRAVRRVPPAAAAPVVLALLLAVARLALPKNVAREVAYSDLVAGLREGAVAAVAFEEDSRRIYFSKNAGDDVGSDTNETGENAAAPAPKWPYYARRVPHDEGFLLGLMRDGRVDYRSSPRPAGRLLVDMLSTLLTLWVSLVPVMWFIQRQMSGAGGADKRRKPRKQRVGFDDVQGIDEAKEELVEIVSCLHGSLNYKKLGAKLPRGVLLVGPPGTGKTLLARAVAGEAGIPFFSVSASEFVEVFVGRGAARVRDLFKEAKEAAPSIIFIDELDAVGGSRGRSFNDERDQTLNQLLTEMDGFDSDMKVIVMAATNRPKALDAALCRPGRFSRKVVVGMPDVEGRKKILDVHLRNIPLEEDHGIISDLVARVTPGLVGADLANIVNESALLAARRGRNTVSREDIMDAIEREKYGVTGRQEADSERQGLTKLFPWLSKPGNKPSSPDDFRGLMGYHTLS
ncbi:probable inactive ATP-dependent zinc metalloprotease FTSHI 3, chloroplastic [Zea mays]|uniref:AAA+ ATPase domain-containing protein n=2 Tax=Zea mays TaxID=4577 RepID=A0A804MEX9_MAIZE|nr:probable inactive ATP-dependent zinc metalloprotease FTSHI 3, chloroplastic [Zea mays]|eukprot:XP_008669303.1 probable inactive ATP-dependent zinc metalloprotease FTSHI 3, chloroplastic [Zea mays]